MDVPEPVTPAKDIVTDDDNGIILAQPAITLPAPVSNTPMLTVDADGAQPQKSGGTPADVLDV